MAPSARAPVAARDARNVYADLLRSASIVAVVFGHWLATGVRDQDHHYVGVDALTVVSWGPWVTLVLQVIPVFFLVGGYANAASWVRHRDGGEEWQAWVINRVRRLLLPTCVYLGVIALFMLAGQLLHGDPRELAEAGWALSLHLWFLAAYMVVLLCTPALYAAHRRWGLGVPLVMVVAAAVIDTGVVEFRWHVVGWANYLLVWGCFHQVGFSWRDGLLAGWRRGGVLACVACVALVGLIWIGPYPISMVGVPGARIQNPSPPSTALLAFGLIQCGVAVALEQNVTRWLARHRRARAVVDTAGALTMPIYLWHMVPVVTVVLAGYLTVVGDPAIGSGQWWTQRPIWIVTLGLVLAVVLLVLARLSRLIARQRHPHRSSTGADDQVRLIGATFSKSSTALLVVGVVVASVGIAVLAIHGFAPHGQLDATPLIEVALGLLLVSGARRRRWARSS